MSLIVQALQIATVAALEEAELSAKVFDSMVDPRDLKDEETIVVVVSAVEGTLNIKDKALFSAPQTVDLCIDLAIARKVTRTVTEGEGEEQTVTEVDFPDNGSGHDFILRTTAYECFRALQASNGTWAELWRELWTRGSQESPSKWERGTASDKGVRLGILRYILKLEVLDDPTPGEAIEAGSTWAKLLTAMETVSDLADKAKLWRSLITSPSLPEWRRVQAELGLTLAGARGSAIGPVEGADDLETGDETTAVTIEHENQADNRTDILSVTDDDDATLKEGDAAAVVLVEEEPA